MTDGPGPSLPLLEIAQALTTVVATRSRKAKAAALADLLRRASPDEIPAIVGIVLGRVRQGRIGIGYRGLLAARDMTSAAAVPSLTVADVDSSLDRYAAAQGAGSATSRRTLLAELLGAATPLEQDLLIRSLGGEVRTGALDGVIVDATAAASGAGPDAIRRAAMLSGSLPETVAMALREPGRLAEVQLTPGIAVQPMLASTAADVASAMASLGAASVEHKLDGARIQVHRRGDDVRVFTRTLADVTARVPEIEAMVRALDCSSVVLDGETLMLDDSGAPRPFQETMSRFGSGTAREQQLAPRFFDLLHLDGNDLLDAPLGRRRDLLGALAGPCLVDGTITDDPAVAEQVLADSLAAGHEGVMVKAIDSHYAAGRRGTSWLKVKPVHTYDLVVLAAEWGSGRREGWLSNLHLGARDPHGHYGEPGGFVMVGKTFKGLTDELLRWQTETFPDYETHRSRHAVHLRPEIVVEIAIDGVQASPRYPGGVALRFARVKGYRPDKPAAEADTIDTLRTLLRGA